MSRLPHRATCRRAPALVAVLVTVACGDRSLSTAPSVGEPRTSASVQPADASTLVCRAATPLERLAAMRRGVDALPAAAALAARTRLRPQLGEVEESIGRGHRDRVVAGLRAFVGEIAELRLRAPFEERLVLATEAECLLAEYAPTDD